MVPLAKHGNGQDGCRIPRPGSSWRANHAREAAVRRLRVIVGTTLVLTVVTAVPARADILIGFVGPLIPTA